MSEAQTANTDFWHVQLLSGEVRYWSLDELDQAFQHGDVDGATFVLQQGETAWVRLGELLGLDESAGGPPSAVPASRAVESTPVWSTRPVVSDVESLGTETFDEDLAAFKPKRKKVIAIGVGAAAVLTLAIAAVSSANGGGEAKAIAAAPTPAVVAAPQLAEEPAPPATLSDETKKALLDADKARAARAAEKAKARAAAAAAAGPKTSYRAPKSGQVFHNGGNRYDPLNSQE